MTTIAWTTESWNPFRATDTETGKVGWYCQLVSPGCQKCYAQQMNRYRGNGHKYDVRGREGLTILIDEKALRKPLGWKKGLRIFVCSMTDLFLEEHSDYDIARVFAIMAIARQHTFQVLTKRASRARKLLSNPEFASVVGEALAEMNVPAGGATIHVFQWPLPNVHLGVSAEDQARADARIPELLETPAAVRWVSYEPALGPIDFTKVGTFRNEDLSALEECVGYVERAKLDWIVVGGESGPGARAFDPIWASDVINACRGMDTKVFVKQMGSVIAKASGYADSKGEDPNEWPLPLQVREYPQ